MRNTNDLHNAEDFTATDLVVYTEHCSWSRSLFTLSDAVKKWDGIEADFALYSDLHDVYSPVRITVTGRTVRDGNRVTVRLDFEADGDREVVRGEVVLARKVWARQDRDAALAGLKKLLEN